MTISAKEIAKHLDGDNIGEEDRFILAPCPNSNDVRKSGSASIDLRLGTWFVTTKASRHSLLDVYIELENQPFEQNISDKHYVPLGRHFILHPNSFVLAATLEWIRIPKNLCGFVTGKSSWGRRGLIIETAPGVHPGFSGCLTLELANVGTIPIKLVTGTKICQLFLHNLIGDLSESYQSSFLAKRQPVLGKVKPDNFVKTLMMGAP